MVFLNGTSNGVFLMTLLGIIPLSVHTATEALGQVPLMQSPR